MEEEKKIDNLVEYVESKRVTKMVVSSLPVSVYKDFKYFAINNAGDNYSMAIKMLLDYYNFSVDREDIIELKEDMTEMKKVVQELVNEVQDKKVDSDKKEIPTFGKKED